MRYVLLFTCALVVAVPSLPNAQIGGLIKKKIIDSAKKPDDPAPSTQKPATPATTQPANDPNLIPITDASLTALERGLQTEITLRAAYKKELEDQAARVKQYQQCSAQANTSPEALALAQKMATAFEKVKTQEDTMKVTAQINAERDAMLAKKCGQAPGNPTANEERLNDIMRKAAAAAGPIQ
jgi:hypothetical protein